MSRARPLIKICGLSTAETLEAALDAGADLVGLVFFDKSPRHLSLEQAGSLAAQARNRARLVVLTVDADDRTLAAIVEAVKPDWLQLHGRETPARVAEAKTRFGRPILKAIGVSAPGDVAGADLYAGVADMILFDAKPPKGAVLPGGNGLAFDWTLLRDAASPFMLSGGLSPDTVAEAIRIAAPESVDVSSGVESAPGVKDPAKIRAFVAAARGASARG